MVRSLVSYVRPTPPQSQMSDLLPSCRVAAKFLKFFRHTGMHERAHTQAAFRKCTHVSFSQESEEKFTSYSCMRVQLFKERQLEQLNCIAICENNNLWLKKCDLWSTFYFIYLWGRGDSLLCHHVPIPCHFFFFFLDWKWTWAPLTLGSAHQNCLNVAFWSNMRTCAASASLVLLCSHTHLRVPPSLRIGLVPLPLHFSLLTMLRSNQFDAVLWKEPVNGVKDKMRRRTNLWSNLQSMDRFSFLQPKCTTINCVQFHSFLSTYQCVYLLFISEK